MAGDMRSAKDDSSPPAADIWTVQRILLWTTSYLKQKGVESPRLEAELLLAHARDCPRIRLYTDFQDPLSEQQRARMRELVQRRARREPLAYIVGTKEFYGRSFEVGPGVLIPRPETETLIDVCLEHLPLQTPTRILEVGFGSGCIAVTLAKQRELCHVTATDCSAAAMQIATRNVIRHDVVNRVELLLGDCLEPVLRRTPLGFDALVSNPPYVRVDELSGLQPEVGLHEPPTALVSGSDGLDLTRRIVQDAAGVVRAGGLIALELDPAQCATVATLLSESGFEEVQIQRDLSARERIVHAVRCS